MTEAIRLDGVGKRYWKLDEQAMLLRSLIPFRRPNRTELWALRHLNLSVDAGEVVGIIGRNGAGKTTLLRLLAGVTQPTVGRARIVGRVAPLISVGVGFHQEMSGRENVYVNGMLLGLSRDEVDGRFDAIVAFSELGDFIDTPVKFYSSGMYMRLGFSVAIHTDPQILLVDEVLAVGDMAFQLKCLERMKEIRERGTTIVLVSHSMQAIRLLCPRAVVIRGGEIAFDGPTEEAITVHFRLLGDEQSAPSGTSALGNPLEVISRELIGPAGETTVVATGDPLRFRMIARAAASLESPVFAINVHSQDGSLVYRTLNPLQVQYSRYEPGAEMVIEMAFTAKLMGGNYRITTHVFSNDGRQLLMSDHGLMFFVPHRPWHSGLSDLEATLAIDGTVLEEKRTFALADDVAASGAVSAVEDPF